jgi:hypothetical protein
MTRMSYRSWRRIATAAAAGTSGRVSRNRIGPFPVIQRWLLSTANSATAHTSQVSCSRSTPRARRNRTTSSATLAASTPTSDAFATVHSGSAAWKAAGSISGGTGRSVTARAAGASTVWASKASPLITVSPISQPHPGLRGRPVGNSCTARGRAIPIPSGHTPMNTMSRARRLPAGRVACRATAIVPARVATAKQRLWARNSQPIGFPGRLPATSPPMAAKATTMPRLVTR